MSGSRRHKRRRPDRRPDPRRVPFPPRRPSARMQGGPLDGVTVRLELADVSSGTVLVDGGRYVRIDADEWCFERDWQPARRVL